LADLFSTVLLGASAAVAQGIIGNRADGVFCAFSREVGRRIAGRSGLPANHDAVRAIRSAQLQALDHVLSAYAGGADPEWADYEPPRAQIFLERGRAWVSAELSAAQSAAADQRLMSELTTAMEKLLSAPRDGDSQERRNEIKRRTEAAALSEFEAALEGVATPVQFRTMFAHGGEGALSWYDAFAAYLLDAVKTDERFRSVFVVSKISEIAQTTSSTQAIVERLEMATLGLDAVVRETLSKKARRAKARTDEGRPSREQIIRRTIAAYEALGFQVARNVSMHGLSLDLVANKHVSGHGLLTTVIVVHTSSKRVRQADVAAFIASARNLIGASAASGAVMIALEDFSAEAKAAAREQSGVRLLTLEQLESELFNPADALARVLADYQNSEIAREYIAVPGRTPAPHPDVAQYVLDWLDADQRLLVVAGDFGAGKTTVLERVRYELTRRFLADEGQRYPIMLQLRALRHYQDLWQFISASLRDRHYIAPSRGVFEQQLRAGRLVLLLDGFDEIDASATATDRARYLQLLAPLLESRSPCILATRPTYFESFDEMADAFGEMSHGPRAYQRIDAATVPVERIARAMKIGSHSNVSRADLGNIIWIDSLTDQKVREYLERHGEALHAATGKTPAEIQQGLAKIYDLEDLSRRPLLLKMVVATITGGRVDITGGNRSVGPSTLYEIYTQLSVQRDRESRDDQVLTGEERLQVCRVLARAMAREGVLQLGQAQVREAIATIDLDVMRAATDETREELLERIMSDIRVCSFLSMSEDRSLRFAHKSFCEFFVAQSCYIDCLRDLGAFVDYARRPNSREVVYFLGSYARDHEPFFWQSQLALSGSKEVRALAARIMFASGARLDGETLSAIEIADVDMRRARIAGLALKKLRCERVTLRDIEAHAWRVEDTIVSSSLVERVSFFQNEGAFSAQLEESVFEGVSWRGGVVRLQGRDWQLADCRFERASVALAGPGRLRAVTFEDCPAVAFAPSFAFLAGSQLHISRSAVATDAWHWSSAGDETLLEDCLLAGVWMSAGDLVASVRTRGAVARRTLRNCRGLVFCALAELDPSERGRLRGAFGDVLVVDNSAIRGDGASEDETPSGDGEAFGSLLAGQEDAARARAILERLRNEASAQYCDVLLDRPEVRFVFRRFGLDLASPRPH